MKKEKERELTQKEKIRTEKIRQLKEKMEGEGYAARDLTIGIVKANVMALLLGAPPCVLFAVLYLVRLARGGFYVRVFSLSSYLLFLGALLGGIVVHEGIHGLFWGMLNPEGFKAIEFGMIMKYLTPYCTCLCPMTKSAYVVGAAMPGILLGILPLAGAVLNGSYYFLLFGMIMTVGAGGDAAILLKLFTFKSGCREKIYVDHPTMCGLIVFER